jgi:Domain of unknown function (DUF4404)
LSNTEHTQLQESLTRLHAELAAAPSVDAASRELLREVLADIERVLQQAPPQAPAVAPRSAHRVSASTSMPRLEALAIEFDAEHPMIAGSLRQLVDLLGRAGL